MLTVVFFMQLHMGQNVLCDAVFSCCCRVFVHFSHYNDGRFGHYRG